MRITIVCVGKVRERYLRDAVAEYTKRISRFCAVDIVEVSDCEIPDKTNESIEEKIKEKEGEEILRKIKRGDVNIALDIRGCMLDSCELAKKLDDYFVLGNSHINFIIGGSIGLGKNVLDKVDYRLSFSKMTFPHQLMRVILLEQVYRCMKISHGETYHK